MTTLSMPMVWSYHPSGVRSRAVISTSSFVWRAGQVRNRFNSILRWLFGGCSHYSTFGIRHSSPPHSYIFLSCSVCGKVLHKAEGFSWDVLNPDYRIEVSDIPYHTF